MTVFIEFVQAEEDVKEDDTSIQMKKIAVLTKKERFELSKKNSDSSTFIDEKETIITEWILVMRNKLEENDD